MGYIASWTEFQDAAEALYLQSPGNTRYCVKWRTCERKLVLKITDNTKCLKFKTSSSIFLNRFEALNLSLMQKMQNWKPPPPAPAVLSAIPAAVPSRAATPAMEEQPVVSAAGTPTGGVAKKKKPKKKK